MLYFAHATLGFGYHEIDTIPNATEYILRMMKVHQKIYESHLDDQSEQNTVIPDLPPIKGVSIT